MKNLDDDLIRYTKLGIRSLVKILIDCGADVNTRGGICLVYSCNYKDSSISKILLEAGANVRGGKSVDALVNAVGSGNQYMIGYLIEFDYKKGKR